MNGIWRHQLELLRELVFRDLRLRYKRSALGILWSLFNPLLQLLVFGFVFSLVLPLNIPHFTLFLFIGLLAWNWFQSSLLEATGAIVDNRDLIRRPGFSSVILPVVPVLTNFIHFLLALPILLVALWWNAIPLNPWIVALPFVLTGQFVVTLSLSYVVAALNVEFRDVRYLLSIILLLGFYLVPIIYDTSSIPLAYQPFYRLNPLVTLIESYRNLLLYGTRAPVGALLLVIAGGLVMLWLGVHLFQRMSVHFAEEL